MFQIIHHPLIADELTRLRDPSCPSAESIRFACLVAAPEGIAALESAYPDIPIHAAAVDRCLDEFGYILPGLGDAGDRMFGTGA